MDKQSELPNSVRTFLKNNHFSIEKVLSCSPTFVIRGTSPEHGTSVVIKIAADNPRDYLRLRNHILWAKSAGDSIPQGAKFHVAPILGEGHEGSLQWYMMPYVEGRPLAVVEGEVTIVDAQLFRKVLPAIIRLMKYIESIKIVNVSVIDARL